jgi:CDP-6-deoxy-D-xylo-4-hexulose-3-dehydrase
MSQDTDRQSILEQVRQFASGRNTTAAFRPGEDPVPVSGKVLGAEEFVSMVDACLDGWLTTGRFNEALEKRLAEFIGCSHVRTVNSGSSANLVAFAALTSPLLGKRALRAGDEVITVAAGFPTTVNPMLLYGMVPVFVDVLLGSYNIDVSQLEAAISPRTRAIMLAHTLGNPFDLDAVMAFARKHDLWVIEDCCDALGSTWRGQHVGTFGHIGTLSFYPAHHITMGEGGAVFASDDTLVRAIESIRDWGRDCWCPPGRDNTCGRRFCWKLGDLPEGYDHKYVYSHLGYNLKISDMQAACGLAQMDRLPGFVEARRRNFDYLRLKMADLEEYLILPEATSESQPSWFGFPVTLRETANVNRVDLLRYLEQNRIGTRLLFAGNLTRQPYFAHQTYRCVGDLPNTDRVMRDTLWVGVFPALTEEQLMFVTDRLGRFFGVGW